PSHAGRGLQRGRPRGGGPRRSDRSAAAQSSVLTRSAQAANADQRLGNVRAAYGRLAQSRVEVKREDFTQLSLDASALNGSSTFFVRLLSQPHILLRDKRDRASAIAFFRHALRQ